MLVTLILMFSRELFLELFNSRLVHTRVIKALVEMGNRTNANSLKRIQVDKTSVQLAQKNMQFLLMKTFISTLVSTSVMGGISICTTLQPFRGIGFRRCRKAERQSPFSWICCSSPVTEIPMSAATSCCCLRRADQWTVCHCICGWLPNAVYSSAGVKFDSSNNPEHTRCLIHKRLYNQSRE